MYTMKKYFLAYKTVNDYESKKYIYRILQFRAVYV